MNLHLYKPSRIVVFIGTAVFFLVATFGIWNVVGMEIGFGGQMADCPFMSGGVICNMTPLQHITASQNLFTVLPQQKDTAFLVLFFTAVFIAFTTSFLRPFLPPRLSVILSLASNREYILFHRSLQEAFSQGILHSRRFDFAAAN